MDRIFVAELVVKSPDSRYGADGQPAGGIEISEIERPGRTEAKMGVYYREWKTTTTLADLSYF